MDIPFILFYNIVEDSLYNQGIPFPDHRNPLAPSGSLLKKFVLRRSPNQGKDIGGKLVLIDACLREGIDPQYCIFLHDKKSPYKIQNQQWKDKLFRIVEPAFAHNALDTFIKDGKVGIIAGADTIRNEYDPDKRSFVSKNQDLLTQLQPEYNIVTKDHRYVAGTMFWARWHPLFEFFKEHPPLDIRKTLERGNIMDDSFGTFTHSWERLLTWLIFTKGYKIKGIE
jgi:lipopolysaccharide biosynthesis protein